MLKADRRQTFTLNHRLAGLLEDELAEYYTANVEEDLQQWRKRSLCIYSGLLYIKTYSVNL